jgi:hypothetical protein
MVMAVTILPFDSLRSRFATLLAYRADPLDLIEIKDLARAHPVRTPGLARGKVLAQNSHRTGDVRECDSIDPEETSGGRS